MTPRTLRNWILLAAVVTLLWACLLGRACFGAAPTVSLYVPTPTATRVAPCPVFACIDCGRRKEMIGSTTYGWTPTTGSEYSLDVGLSTLSLTGSGTVSSVRVKEGVELSDAYLTEGSGTGALNAGEWFLDGDTLHVRLSDGSNPASATEAGVQVSFDLGTAGDANGWAKSTVLWQVSGTAVASWEDRWRYVNDKRPQLGNKQIDMAGQTATGNWNRPRGWAMGWVAQAGTLTITATVINSSGESTVLTTDITVTTGSRETYSVNSAGGADYSTLAACLADDPLTTGTAIGARDDVTITVEGGHTENYSSQYLITGDGMVIQWDGNGAKPLFTNTQTGAQANTFFFENVEHTVMYGLRITDSTGNVADDSTKLDGFEPGDFSAIVSCEAVGAAGSEGVSFFTYDAPNYGLLVQNCTTEATADYSFIQTGNAEPENSTHLIFVGNDFGPSSYESCWRIQGNNHYITVAWSKHEETNTGGSPGKSACRVSDGAFVQVYGCYFLHTDGFQQTWIGRTNQGQGIGSTCVRFESCHTDALEFHEDAAEAWWINDYVDSTYGELGSVTNNINASLIYDSGMLHCTIAGGTQSAAQWALTSGTDHHENIQFNANAWVRDSTANYFLRFGSGTVDEINNNHLFSDTFNNALASVWVGGSEDSTLANVAALNAEAFATGNTAQAFTLDSELTPSSPLTVATEPGVFDDYYGWPRGSISYAGAVDQYGSQGPTYQTFIPGVVIQPAP